MKQLFSVFFKNDEVLDYGEKFNVFEKKKLEEQEVVKKKELEDVKLVQEEVILKESELWDKVFVVGVDKKLKEEQFKLVEIGDKIDVGYDEKVKKVKVELEMSVVVLSKLEEEQKKVQEVVKKVKKKVIDVIVVLNVVVVVLIELVNSVSQVL